MSEREVGGPSVFLSGTQPLPTRQLGMIGDAIGVARNRANIISVPGVLNLFSMQTDGSRGNITAALRVERREECRCGTGTQLHSAPFTPPLV